MISACRQRTGAAIVFAIAMACPVSTLAGEVSTRQSGVVVEQVTSLAMDTPAALQVNDVIVAYRPRATSEAPGARVLLRDALQWRLLESAELLRRPVTLDVLRAGELRQLSLADGQASLRVRSRESAGAVDDADLDLLRATAARDWVAAESAFRRAQISLGAQADVPLQALIALHGAQLAIAQSQWQAGRDRLAPALAALPESLLRISLMEADILCTGQLRDWRVSQQTLRTALPVVEREAPRQLAHARIAAKLAQIDSFADPKDALTRVEAALVDARAACAGCEGTGWVLYNYGDVLWNLHRVTEAGDVYAESLAIARAVTPGQRAVALRLIRSAITLRRSGRPHLAEPLLREALTLMQQLSAPELDLGSIYNELGAIASQFGDLQAARAWYTKSLPSSRGSTPLAIEGAAPLHNLAQVAIAEGDYAAADRLLLDATRVLERAGNGPNLALFLTTRAQLETLRGNDELAATMLERVRDLQTAVNPAAEILGTTYVELSKLYLRRQDVAASNRARDQAIEIFEKLPGDAYVLAVPLAEFGIAELGLGHLLPAEAYFERSLRLFQQHAADSLRSTIAWQGAGEAALARHDHRRARLLVGKALEIRLRDAPDTASVAQSLHTLGRIAHASRRFDEAHTRYCEAAAVLDKASLRSGGDDLGEARFRAQFADVYHDCLLATVDAGDATTALGVLERSRARGFRRALEQRRLNLQSPSQQRAVAAVNTNALAYERALDSANAPALDAATRELARARVRELQDQRAPLQRKLVAALPEFAHAYLPERSSTQAIAARVPADTTYIAYSVGAADTVVIAVRAGAPVIAKRIALDRDTLAARVRALRGLIDDPSDAAQGAFRKASDALSRELLAPVAAYISASSRLWISPDAALHDLPFAALWQSASQRYLIETHTLTFIDALASVGLPPAPNIAPAIGATLLAVGDPKTGPDAQPEIGRRLRGVRADMDTLPALPAARREVQSLARRYGSNAQLLIGEDATEARVRDASAAAGGIHFAVHALFDPLRPLDSALVLHPGSEQASDDGFLQVWEIFEGPRLNADLVVLSGCDTAAGQVFAGEGLLGFSRAFAFAGARATVASLWPVDDDATAELMEHFYAARDRGQKPAQSLRTAMLAMLRSSKAERAADITRGVGGLSLRTQLAAHRNPYYWAAFQVYGE